MSEWREVTLGEISSDVSYGYTESAKKEKVGPKFLRITDIANGRLNWDDVPHCPISEENFEKYRLIPGDIVIARTGATTGANYIIKDGDPEDLVFASYLIRYRINHELSDPFFVGHLLQSSIWNEYVDAIAGGSAQPGANAKLLGSFEFQLPPLSEQKSIASALSSLDDKIDLLHRQNKTLEQMAETLFRQWFVEEAKEDWEEGKLEDLVENIRDSVSVDSIDADMKYVALEHIEKRNIALKNFGLGKDIASNKYAFEKCDILFGKLRPYFHKVCITPFYGICSTDILVLRPKSSELTYFALFAFFQDSVVEYANLGSGGTRMPRTDWKTLSQYPFRIPRSNHLEKFNSIVSPSVEKIIQNISSIRTLENLRDTLLPKLMSGEVKIM